MLSETSHHRGDRIPLADDEVHVWHVATADVRNPTVLDWCRDVMNDEEIERQQRFHFEKDRRQCLVTRGLVRGLLSRYADVDPADWVFSAGNFGKPHIRQPAEFRWLRFNLSHTRGMVLCAVTRDVDVGADVECLDRRVNLDLAERFFAQVESARLRTFPPDEQSHIFFDYWTLKEAFIKAHGAGLSLPLSDFWFARGAESPLEIGFSAKLAHEDPSAWRFFSLYPSPQHRAAVAVRRRADADCRLLVRQADWLCG
jgi:4'-phosphopantetheinyl transferase